MLKRLTSLPKRRIARRKRMKHFTNWVELVRVWISHLFAARQNRYGHGLLCSTPLSLTHETVCNAFTHHTLHYATLPMSFAPSSSAHHRQFRSLFRPTLPSPQAESLHPLAKSDNSQSSPFSLGPNSDVSHPRLSPPIPQNNIPPSLH
jgi:hypothetical protein